LLDERRGMHWLHELERVTARRSEPLLSDREQQVCAQCHSLRSAVAEGYHAGLPLLDFYRPELLSDPLYFADGQQREEVFITGNFAQSRMHAGGSPAATAMNRTVRPCGPRVTPCVAAAICPATSIARN